MSKEKTVSEMVIDEIGLDVLPSIADVTKFVQGQRISARALSILDRFDVFESRHSIATKFLDYVQTNHASQLNMAQPNNATLSWENIRSWGASFLKCGMIEPIIVTTIEGLPGYHVLAGRHRCTLLVLAYGFDIEIPVSIVKCASITEAKQRSLVLNGCRHAPIIESSSTWIPQWIRDANPSEKGWGIRFAMMLLGRRATNASNANKHQDRQQAFHTVRVASPEYLANPEIGITQEILLKELGITIPSFRIPIRKSDATKGEGFTAKQIAAYFAQMTIIPTSNSDEEIWQIVRNQWENAECLLNEFFNVIEEFKNEAKQKDDSDSRKFLQNIGYMYVDGVIKAMGLVANIHLYANGRGNARYVRKQNKDIRILARRFATSIACSVIRELTDGKTKQNQFVWIFMEKVLSGNIPHGKIKRLTNMKDRLIVALPSGKVFNFEKWFKEKNMTLPWAA